MKYNPRYTLKHLSIRVPWHDAQWNGTICKNPMSNGACLILKNCAQNRNDKSEQILAGHSFEQLTEEELPVCIGERANFMAPFQIYRTLSHPYVENSPSTHGHLKPTRLLFPAYSAAAVPYHWMLKENAKEKTAFFDLDYEEQREPMLDWAKNAKDHWVQELHNQKALLNCFFGHLEENTSLVFFYMKQVPFVEESNRVLAGVGRITKIIPSEAYEGSNNRFGAAYWEHMVLHTIRPNGKDGFLLPYHAAIEYQKNHPEFDINELAVKIPRDKQFEFSYGGEHVSNDSAIRVLLACAKSLEKANALGIIDSYSNNIEWIHNEIAHLEKLRGVYPGMGAALCAFGIEKGHFVAAEIINQIDPISKNPWVLFEEALDNPQGILSDEIARLIPDNAKKLYKCLKEKNNSYRITFLHLLSRFDLSIEQAKFLFIKEESEKLGIEINEEECIKNPYLLYEKLRYTTEPMALSTIDLGLYIKTPPINILPNNLVYHDPLDTFRIRALTVQQLEAATLAGHTLLPRKEIIQQIRGLSIVPTCPINSDYFDLAEEIFHPIIGIETTDNGERAYQLDRFVKTREIIAQKIKERINGKRLSVGANWETLLQIALQPFTKGEPDEQEKKARQEKTAALKEIAEARFSVLIGPAGTGKTTLLSILAGQEDIINKGVLLLAPTGKARVRMEGMSKNLNVTTKTLAQFLSGYNRYRGDTQQYVFTNNYCEGCFETVILDEASMFTEEMLATTLDCLKGVKRFILVGDHRQLPPIGPGRPFVDIIQYLKMNDIATNDVEYAFPRIKKGYVELTIKRRQGGNKREDIQLAEWFSGEPLEPGADSIINQMSASPNSQFLRLEYWQNEIDFERIFEKVLIEELELTNIENVEKFNKTLGSVDGKYFNFRNAVKNVEDWQILSPVREKIFGVKAINRKIHKLFRENKINFARGKQTLIPAPIGLEEIVYGDKVINLYNQKRNLKDVWPKENCLSYIANGEIGMVIGQVKSNLNTFPGKPKNTEIEFTSQPGFKYTFKALEFKEEGENPLELAYALTVHKAQGSEFGKVFLIIPNPCLLLTREMLYTSLTRQKEKVIILYQGNSFDLTTLTSPLRSDALKRITNLFTKPKLIEFEGHYLEQNLIQQASDGKMLRSKSELLIYQRLIDNHYTPLYEKKLIIKEVEKLPDFTIENDNTGEVFYWEHCGMLYDLDYKQRWEEKYQWYRENNIFPWEEGGGKNGTLIVTHDKACKLSNGSIRGAISVQEIDEIINNVLNNK